MFADAQASQIGVKLAAGKAKTEVKPNIATEITDLKVTGKNDYIIPVVAVCTQRLLMLSHKT
ncbi:hypothetical protein AB6F55_05880 [Providencia hangzhouensis]